MVINSPKSRLNHFLINTNYYYSDCEQPPLTIENAFIQIYFHIGIAKSLQISDKNEIKHVALVLSLFYKFKCIWIKLLITFTTHL